MKDKCTEESFLKDVANHHMKILRNDGLYRHIRFSEPGTWCMGFDLITWPGYLCYTGDMGTYVFQRLEDMFEFFRDDRWQKDKNKLYISESYWAEKCQAADKSDGIKEYSPDKFREAVNRWLEGDEDVTPEIKQAIEDEVLSHADDGEYEARRAAHDLEHDGFRFVDFFEANLTVYTYRFIWCCYAMAWAIQQYDNLGEKHEQSDQHKQA